MKICMDADKIIVFLNNKNSCFKDKMAMKDYFKDLFFRLHDEYEIELHGYYNVDVYHDTIYGYILEITNQDLYDYFEQVDMQINIIEMPFFLYEVDYSNLPDIDATYYKKGDKIYIKIHEIDDITLGCLLEHANIIYGDKTSNIIKHSEKVQI